MDRGDPARHQRNYQARKKLAQHDPDKIPHGTPGGYTNWGCRCDRCRDAKRGHKLIQRMMANG